MKIKLLILLLITISGCATAKVNSLKEEQKSDFELFPNGAAVLWVKDNHMPLIEIAVVVKSGAASDPMAQSGLTHFMLSNWMENSSVSEKFAQLGASYNYDMMNDFFVVSGASLSEKKTEMMDLFFTLLKKPQFNPKNIEIRRQQILSGIKRIPENPELLSEISFDKFIFGAHPYGWPTYGDTAHIKKITLKQISDHYEKLFSAHHMIFIVCGDYDETYRKSFSEKVGAIKQKAHIHSHRPRPPQINNTQILLIDKPDVQQAQIIMGQFGVEKKSEDYMKLKLAQTILGGTFTSRLNQKIRVEKGYTYDIHSDLEAYVTESIFKISTSTKNENVNEVILEIMSIVKNFVENGVSSEELELAQNNQVGKLVRFTETSESVAVWKITQLIYGQSTDGSKLKNINQGISDIRSPSTGEVNRAIKKYIHPTQFKIVVVAPAKKVLKSLQKIGLVEVQKVTDI